MTDMIADENEKQSPFAMKNYTVDNKVKSLVESQTVPREARIWRS